MRVGTASTLRSSADNEGRRTKETVVQLAGRWSISYILGDPGIRAQLLYPSGYLRSDSL